MLAASAYFLETATELADKLSCHVKFLVDVIVREGYRSPEIVLGFILNVPWMETGSLSSPTPDKTCYYLSTALSMAIDLSLYKIVIPSSVPRPQALLERLTPQNSLTAAVALHLDCHEDLLPSSDVARRALRSRERIWLCLYALEQGVCLARGRIPTVPTGMVIDHCENWHISEISHQNDGPIVAATVLRRDTHKLISSIRTTCDSCWSDLPANFSTTEWIQERIERFFEYWQSSWSFQVRSGGKLTPYLKIVATHTKLAAYCSAISHPSAPKKAQQPLCAAAIASALDVMKTALEPEVQQMAMPNNTIIMIAFAACFYLGLMSSTSNSLDVRTKDIIVKIVDFLEVKALLPRQRQRVPVIFCQHIRHLLDKSSVVANAGQPRTEANHRVKPGNETQDDSVAIREPPSHGEMGETGAAISDMTYDQILEEMTLAQSHIDSISANYWSFNESEYLDTLDLCFEPNPEELNAWPTH